MGSSIPYFTTLIPKIMNSKFGGGAAGYFFLQYLTKVYLQNYVQFLYPTFFKLPWKMFLKFVNNRAKTKKTPQSYAVLRIWLFRKLTVHLKYGIF